MTIQIQATSHKAAKAVLSRIYKKYDVFFTDDELSVTGAALTARIVLDDGYEDVHPAEQRTYKRTVEIYSNYYSDHTIAQLAEEVKGRGTVLA